MEKHYSAQETEKKWYSHWTVKKYFNSKPDGRKAYSIVIPPPNVTGLLHMGHMLNNTIQDVLIRRARLLGMNACWVPGTDHASIATEAKVVQLLREKGIKKSDISRQEFLKYAFEWKDKYGGIILDQLKMLGASCDWDRTRFTMEPKLSDYVIKVFVDLYKKGLIYRGLRMINWDPEAKTALSNEEVQYHEEDSKLYKIRYKIHGSEDEWLTIATTRPETILGDSAVAVNPEDDRYAHLKGKSVVVPMVNRVVPVIFDNYVEMEFGTGALKVTPAHDMNDNEIGARHKLESIDIFNDNGTMSENARFYVGMDRFEVRKQIIKDLKAQGHIVAVENYKNKVGRSERTGAVVEPRLKEQWFLKMEKLSEMALSAVENGDIRFFPDHMINMYRNWLKPENVRDWCVSRQLWWGQQIPAYYHKTENLMFVAENEESLLTQIEKENAERGSANGYLSWAHDRGHQLDERPLPLLKREDFIQDEDVVDTWFSSWLWPIAVFDGFENQEELKYYYPTNVLVTGWDIMFFWVARMIMAGYEWAPELLGAESEKKPFNDVYFTGMVRDKLRRKMSKSLGNSPDAIELINKYSADGVRFGMLSCSAAGNDVIFDAPFADKNNSQILNESKLCEQGRNFTNKMWNALKLVKGWEVIEMETPTVNLFAMKWIEQKLNQNIEIFNSGFETYRLSEVLMNIYNFIWDDFCSWYLEMIKPVYGQPIDRKTLDFTVGIFEKMMTILHPYMPFITEEIWSNLKERKDGEDCVISKWPEAGSFDNGFLQSVEKMKEVLKNCRELRAKNQLSEKESLKLMVKSSESARNFLSDEGIKETIIKLGYLETLTITNEEVEASSFLAGTEQYFLIFKKEINIAEEIAKIQKEIEYYQGFIVSIDKKLSNEKFVQNAKPEVVENERKKMADGRAKIQLLEEELKRLS
jgi:valyl-tRNA synthetase